MGMRQVCLLTFAALFVSSIAFAETQHRMPNGIYYTGNWLSSTGNPNTWEDIDDPIDDPDDDASYLYRQDVGAIHVLNHAPFDIDAESILRVYVTARCVRTAAGPVEMRPELKVNGATYAPSPQALTTSWADYVFEWRLNPATGTDWLEADVEGTGTNALQRFQLWPTNLHAGEEVRCTQSFINVEYIAAGDPTAVEAIQGKWSTLSSLAPINPIHIALTRDGSILNVTGSGNDETEFDYRAFVWDSSGFTTMPIGWDMFCNGMAALADGRIFINGGNLGYDPYRGLKRNAIYDPVLRIFTDVEDMAQGRWYPTPLVLGDGRIMSFGGLDENAVTNRTVEFYTAGAGWSPEYDAGWTPPLYPRLHLLPNGKVFYSGWSRESRFFDPATNTWSGVVATTKYGGNRRYGTAVLLPLTPSNGYKPRVMIMGGGDPGTDTTEIIDLSASTPSWQYGPAMSQPRIELNATILPNGKVLVVGGSRIDLDASTASLNADMYDPATNTFSPAGRNAYPRLYHSASLLRPDGRVVLLGGNPERRVYERHIEVYTPPYLFNNDGSLAPRPTVSGISPGAVGYDDAFQVQTPDASDIASVILMRPGAPTHAFDVEQRLIVLSFTKGSGVLNVTAPPHRNVAPPGYYMLFVLDSNGVPSVAKFVRVGSAAPPPNQAPAAAITSPTADVTIAAGESVAFAGTGTDPDGTIASFSWTFAGGTPSSSSVASPGSVTYADAGTYTASFKVTDNDGLSSPTVTRTITATGPPTFSIAATPASKNVVPASSTSFSTAITTVNGFTGAVSLSVSGLPSGAAASFDPAVIAAAGSSTLTISTTGAVPVGSHTLTITGTSGSLTRTTSVTLVVLGEFAISVSPLARTMARGDSTTFAVAVTAAVASDEVTFSATGAPKHGSVAFEPASLTGSGSSTLTFSMRKPVAPGTYTLTVRASSGTRVRSANVTVTIQ